MAFDARASSRTITALFLRTWIAICIGALWYWIAPPQDSFFVKTLLELTHVVGQSTTLLAAIAIGLLFLL
jgi:hypothetical protein